MRKILVLLLSAAVGAFLYGQRMRTEVQRLRRNQDALNQSVEHYRNRLGEEVASVEVLTLRCAEFERLRAEDAATIRQMKLKLHRMEAWSKQVAAQQIALAAPLRDTVILHDTVRIFRWADPWVEVQGRIGRDTLQARIQTVDTLRQVIYRVPRKFLFVRWGTKGIRQEISSTNPHCKVVYSEYVQFRR